MSARKPFVPPTRDELAAYAAEIGFAGFNPDLFLAKQETVGWVVGKARTPMVSWKGAVRTWQIKQAEIDQERKPAARPGAERPLTVWEAKELLTVKGLEKERLEKAHGLPSSDAAERCPEALRRWKELGAETRKLRQMQAARSVP